MSQPTGSGGGDMRQGDYWGSVADFGTQWGPVSAGIVIGAWD